MPRERLKSIINILARAGEATVEKVQYIINSSDQLLAVVSDIVTIASIETKQLKSDINQININELIVELFEIFHNSMMLCQHIGTRVDTEHDKGHQQ